MSDIKIKLIKSGVRKLLRSDDMQSAVNSLAFRAPSRLGDGYEVTYRKGKNRVNAEVAAVSYEAKKDNLDNNSILKAVSSLD